MMDDESDEFGIVPDRLGQGTNTVLYESVRYALFILCAQAIGRKNRQWSTNSTVSLSRLTTEYGVRARIATQRGGSGWGSSRHAKGWLAVRRGREQLQLFAQACASGHVSAG